MTRAQQGFCDYAETHGDIKRERTEIAANADAGYHFVFQSFVCLCFIRVIREIRGPISAATH